MRAPRQRERHAGGVDGDPAPAPLLGDIGRRAGTAGRVQHEVAGVCGHQDTAFDNFAGSLNNIELLIAEAALSGICPEGSMRTHWRVAKISYVRECLPYPYSTISLYNSVHSGLACRPTPVSWRINFPMKMYIVPNTIAWGLRSKGIGSPKIRALSPHLSDFRVANATSS